MQQAGRRRSTRVWQTWTHWPLKRTSAARIKQISGPWTWLREWEWHTRTASSGSRSCRRFVRRDAVQMKFKEKREYATASPTNNNLRLGFAGSSRRAGCHGNSSGLKNASPNCFPFSQLAERSVHKNTRTVSEAKHKTPWCALAASKQQRAGFASSSSTWNFTFSKRAGVARCRLSVAGVKCQAGCSSMFTFSSVTMTPFSNSEPATMTWKVQFTKKLDTCFGNLKRFYRLEAQRSRNTGLLRHSEATRAVAPESAS